MLPQVWQPRSTPTMPPRAMKNLLDGSPARDKAEWAALTAIHAGHMMWTQVPALNMTAQGVMGPASGVAGHSDRTALSL